MHPDKIFRETSKETNIDFARERSFGILSINSQGSPLVSHIPFQLNEDGSYLEAHISKSNPMAEILLNPTDGVIIVSGSDAYISPDWYSMNNQQVPTWNYVAVHLRGTLRRLESEVLPGILDRLATNMEERLKPKPPWKTDKLDEHVYAKMREHIVPICMEVIEIDSTWKLSQNKPKEARLGVADALQAGSVGMEVKSLSKLIRNI